MKRKRVRVSIRNADPVEYAADVLAIKYAQAFYGVDSKVADRFSDLGRSCELLQPRPGECRLIRSDGAVPAQNILVVGVPSLWDFRYEEIRKFSGTILTVLEYECPDARSISLTLHGGGYGLDEIEALDSEIIGMQQALQAGHGPVDLESITIVEGRSDRFQRLSEALSDILPTGFMEPSADCGYHQRASRPNTKAESNNSQLAKPLVFVAMPFSDELEDAYHYAIQGAVRAAGFVCERADKTAFTGDVLTWIQKTIAKAELVVCDLSFANPNVYLELGFAWGARKPTVLLSQEAGHLTFDTRGQRCLIYNPKNIKELEVALARELVGVKPDLE